jgi:O-antigen/teichoic acid export membrane protein
VGGYLAASALWFLATPLLTRYLGVADFGRYVAVGTLITITAVISDAGLAVVGTREYVVREEIVRSTVLPNLAGLRAVVSVAGVFGAVAFAVLAGYTAEMVTGTVVAGLGLVLLMVQQVYTIPLQANLRLGLMSALDLARSASTIVTIVVLVVMGAGLVAFLAAPIPALLMVLVATMLLMRGTTRLRPTFDGREWQRLFREALPIAIASTVGAFYYRSALVVMSIMASSVETGYFSASFRVIEALLIVAALVASSAFPVVARAAENDRPRLRYAMQRLFDAAVILGAWISISVVLGAGVIIRFIGGSEFFPAISVLRIQALALAGSFLVAVWGVGLLGLRRQRTLAYANGVGAFVTVVLTIALVPNFGANGAAVATTVVEFLLAAMYAVALMGSEAELRPSLATVPKVIVAALPALCIWFVPIDDVAKMAFATGIFFAILATLRGIPPDVYDAFRRDSNA